MKERDFASGRAVMALSALAVPAFAQTVETPPAAPPQTSDAVNTDIATTDIIVTGSARAQRRFDVSNAISSLSQADVQRIAPKSFADLLGTVPDIQVEATGGEVQNVTRVRGVPTDRGYLIFQQDGLPLYHAMDGVFFNSGEGMNRYDLMTWAIRSRVSSSSGANTGRNPTTSASPRRATGKPPMPPLQSVKT